MRWSGSCYGRGVGARRVVSLFVAALAAACGARTELYVPLHHDAGPDAQVVHDAGLDVVEEPPDFPPLEPTHVDADKTDCPAETFVWAVSTDDMLLRFDPPSATFSPVGKLVCPGSNGSHPFSMAVDRKGTAWVEYDNGSLYAVSTADGSCQPSVYVPNQMPPFSNFGMGYATIGAGPSEQLFVAADTPGTLGMLVNFKVEPVGEFLPSMPYAELTGTGDGRLFAYYAFGYQDGSYVAELDKTTGKIVAQDPLPTVNRGIGWAFAFWGGDFYLFTTPDGQVTVKYDPATKVPQVVAHYSASIVGAGVSTCAPN